MRSKKTNKPHIQYPSLYAYPAIFAQSQDGDSWVASFPDFPNITDCGADTLTEALLEARYALEEAVYLREQNNEPACLPTSLLKVKHGQNEIVQLIVADMAPVRRAYSQKAVKKTLTIPAWMEDELKKHPDVNVSRLLQEAIKQELNLTDPLKGSSEL